MLSDSVEPSSVHPRDGLHLHNRPLCLYSLINTPSFLNWSPGLESPLGRRFRRISNFRELGFNSMAGSDPRLDGPNLIEWSALDSMADCIPLAGLYPTVEFDCQIPYSRMFNERRLVKHVSLLEINCHNINYNSCYYHQIQIVMIIRVGRRGRWYV